jgi:pilus assembly protein Flp/PilA
MNIRPSSVHRRLRALLRHQRGATAVEYGLIVALIVIGLITAIVSVADATAGIWNNVSDKVTHAG